MNFQEAFWFTRQAQYNHRHHQQQEANNNKTNLDPTTRTKPKSMNSSLSFTQHQHHHNIHQEDIDSEFPDHNDQHSTTTTITTANTSRPPASHQDNYYIIEREPMFEKPLTPSDVGKLNRLVIPKQNAEKYFPLNGSSTTTTGGDSMGEKGLVLSFEDESGKSWRFRYSYWNSSQSYVLTKGWSRFVKEKKLDAGDVVLFERHRLDSERFFIGWRRRGNSGGAGNSSILSGSSAHHGTAAAGHTHTAVAATVMAAAPPGSGGGGGWGTTVYYNVPPMTHHHHQQQLHQQQQQNHQGYSYPHVQGVPMSNYSHHRQQHQQLVAGGDYLHLRAAGTGVQHEKSPGGSNSGGKSASKRRLRLFGVNLDCDHLDDVGTTDNHSGKTSEASSLSSGGGCGGEGSPATANFFYNNNNNMIDNSSSSNANYYDYVGYPSSNHHHMVRNQVD